MMTKALRIALLGVVTLASLQFAESSRSKAVRSMWVERAPAVTAAPTVLMSRLPLRFEANVGQWDRHVRFLARQGGATLHITDEGMTVALTDVKRTEQKLGETPEQQRAAREAAWKDAKSAAVSIKLVGAKPGAPRGEEEMVAKSNFFFDADPAKWRTNVPNYAVVRAKNWLPGVDVVWHGGPNGLEYDLEVAAGVDARKIEFDVDGADTLHVNRDGGLEIATSAGKLVQMPPRVVQDGRELHASYRVSAQRRIALRLEGYDPSSAVLVDPVLTYSTYLGGSGNDSGQAIAVDSSGDVYVTGYTSGSFPTTTGAYQTTFAGTYGAFVTKVSSTGSTLLYSTYLGGISDYGYGIAIDSGGNAYVTGTASSSFPTTIGAYQTSYGGAQDAFVTKLSSTGSLVYSTYVGGIGTDEGWAIAVDSSGNVYATGYSTGSFPTTSGAYQTTFGGSYDSFVIKLSPTGAGLVYSTYLGGSSSNTGNGIAVDSSGSAYVTGHGSGGFPTTSGAYQTVFGGGASDAFVAKLSPTGAGLVYSSYVGGSGADMGNGVAIDSSGDAFVIGSTTGAFPTTTGAYQTTYGGGGDAFAVKLSSTGSTLVYSTYLGGSSPDVGSGIAVDASGNAYATGYTMGSFPTTTGAYQTSFGGDADVFVTKLSSTGSILADSTYLGGSGNDRGAAIAVDSNDNAYVTGYSTGSFPTSTNTYQATFGGTQDAFVAKVATPDLADGASCAQAGACASGLCIDGVCCDAECTDECAACDVSGHEGTCWPVTGAPHGSRVACQTTSACSATCDGTNTTVCTFGPDVCARSCSNGTENDVLCDTTGGCAVPKSHSCNNLVCASEGDGGTCKTSCTSDTDCEPKFTCAADGTCQPGASCVNDHTSQGADGTTKDCSPYTCTTAGTCGIKCVSIDDCVVPNVCDPNGNCVPPPPSGASGCSCDTSSNGAPPWGTVLLGAAVASLIARARRREARIRIDHA